MAIEQVITTTVTCDVCGRELAAGEQWYQVTTLAVSGVFTGSPSGLSEVAGHTLQTCATHYSGAVAGAVAALTGGATQAVAPAAS